MVRAAVFIGVDKAGDLPRLRDAAAGARRLHDEALVAQQFDKRVLLTDENGPVRVDAISDAVQALIKPGNLSLLLIYFAGHGINRNQGEFWLLSDAPQRSSAAVNVRGTEYLARYSRIPHVIFISDACRTMADSPQLQNITGAEIFPNWSSPGDGNPVDQFYATGLGNPAHEIRDPEAAARRFTAVYTQVLLKALRFEADAAIEWSREADTDIAYIRPRKLRNYLKQAVADAIAARQLGDGVIQVPEAIITSEPEAWLSRHGGLVPPAASSPQGSHGIDYEGAFESSREPASTGPRAPISAKRALEALVSLAIYDPVAAASTLSVTASAGPVEFETQCGFKLRGARIDVAYALGASVQQVGRGRDIARVHPMTPRPSVLLVFDNGSGAVLPALPGFIGALNFDGDELIDVAYEPSENTSRAGFYRAQGRELRALRKAVASASRDGSFRLDGEQAGTLALRLQQMKGMNPSLSAYAAYAYNDLHAAAQLREMSQYLAADLDASLFDVAMLAGELDRKSPEQWPPLFGFFPLLAQGWAYLRARRIALPLQDDDTLQQSLTDSLWTVFNPRGVAHLRSTLFREAQPWQPD
jgi:hypothetical protein